MRKLLFPIIIFIVNLFYRHYGLTQNIPFWVDEFSTGKAANQILQYGLGYFTEGGIAVEKHNITTYFITALFFKIFGHHEWVARLPFIIFGSFLPLAVYFLVKKFFDWRTAVSASLLTAFSYLMITWSRQAREFSLLQLLIVLCMFFYLSLFGSNQSNLRRKRFYRVGFLLAIILGVLTHVTFYILIASLAAHYILFHWQLLTKKAKNTFTLFALATGVGFLLFLLWKQGIFEFFSTSFFGANNVWYYHAFLWREYGLITFLAFIGIIVGATKQLKTTALFVIYIGFQLFFVCFMWGHYLSKYILTIFPFLFILAAYTLTQIADTLPKKLLYKYLPIFLTLLIILQGDKFVTKPKAYYSINHDFREIANIDYHQVYSIVKSGYIPGKTAMVETWPDRAKWYLGTDISSLYYFRWQNEEGKASGHSKKTRFFIDKTGEKRLVSKEYLGFVGTANDLQKVMKKYPRGFIFIDDSTLPKDVIDYAEKNLKKELYLDHNPLDDNPYSIWPATLYSWGIRNQ